MSPITRGFRRRESAGDDSRLPPGQHLVGGFPVLSAGRRRTPRSRMTMLDGNAGAGDLQELFAVEVTQLVGVCAGCGTSGPLAEAHAFVLAPGLTLRCPACDAVLARLVHLPERTLFELHGLRRLELR